MKSQPVRALPLPEFVAIMAVLFATLAFSIDAMLPAFPQIAAELTPNDVNRAQLIILAFMLGIGIGTLFTGALSDAYGRKRIITIGALLYIFGAALAFYAKSLDLLLAARFVQGLGAAGPRIVPMAMIRDIYEGRRMAQITSFVMTLFMLVPAVAPSVGAVIINLAGWRFIFVAFIVFATLGVLWLNIRQPETLAPRDRRPLEFHKLREAALEVLSNRLVMIYIAVLTLGFTQLIGLITSTQQVYADIFDKAETFPTWFAVSALLATTGTVLNAKLVMTVGMRRLAMVSFGVQAIFALSYAIIYQLGVLPDDWHFALWFCWSVSLFFIAGLTFGNLNALALQPMGHIAGMAASIVAAISTIISVGLAIPIGQAFNGTPIPLLSGTVLCSGLAYLLMRKTTEE